MGKKSVGIEPEKTRLFGDDDPEPDQNFGDTGFRINKDYANRYDSWRQAEEMQKLKDKYGNDVVNGVADSDSDSTSSEEAEEWTADDERRFLETLGSLKGGASSIYDSSKKFFGDSSEKPSTSQALSKSKPSKMTLKDYERKVILEKQGKVESDEESGEETRIQQEPAYYKKQQEILNQLKSAIKDDNSSDDNDDLLVKREKSQFEQKQEEDDFYEWLGDRKNDLPDFCNSKESGLKKLKEHWSRQDLDEDEKFLRNYLMNKEFDTDGKETEIPTYEEIVNLEEDEGYLAKNSKYEHKYNFRFEEPDQEFIKQFPRTVSESLRQDNSKRKEAREKYKERKKHEKEEKIQELKELKKLKKSEIEKRLEKLSKVAGCEIPLSIEELESEYDPEKFDRKMAEIFNKTYYDQEEKLKEDETMEKPVFSDDEDINKSDAEDSESDGDANDEKPENGSGKKEHEKPEMSSRKRKRQELAALKKKRPLFDPSEKTFDEYLKEYYALDFEDVIGDQTVKFKYRKVTPNDFGLTQEEIVNADDRQLNAWASLKKVTSYRPEEQEKYDVVAYKKRSLDQEKKNRILAMEFGGKKSLLKKEKEKPEQSEQNRNQDGVSKKTEKNRDKRRRKRNNTNADQGQEIQEKNPSQNQSERKNKRRLKKDEKNNSGKGNLNVDDSRLEAYGLNPKKFKQALKYGKKKSHMPREEDVIAAVEKYIDYIKNEKKIGHALRRLGDLPMTVEILSGTGVGRIVNRLKDHDEFGDQAATLVEKWKQIAKKSGVMSRKEKRSHMVQAQKEINEEMPEPEPPKTRSPSSPRYEPIRVKQEIITPEKEPPASSKVVEPLKIKKEIVAPEKVLIKSEPIDQAYDQEEERFPNPGVVRKKIKVEREPVEQAYAQDSEERERSPSPQIIKKKIKVKRERDATPPECSSTYQQQKEQKEPKEKKAKVIKVSIFKNIIFYFEMIYFQI
ncbi:hypothetical protein WR25_04470 [Diploscapter pachys]|uniref:Protein KRI1 homolog n=1 Tax=Diploscapter pachys TaxID=2018661 RepID=A0A2A2LFS6_9BILA|nr:hypothetical protein WR25_04470 [Diploscapter pachys]